MLIGIEKGIRTGGFIENVKKMKLDYKLIDASQNDVMEQLRGIDIFVWHWTHQSYRDIRSARAIIKAAELMGIKVYPDINTCWMFDDKVSQKYLLEALNVPVIPTFVFFDKVTASNWLKECTYPIVYKLPQGAGATNVRLVNTYEEANEICKTHFLLWGNPNISSKKPKVKEICKIWKRMKEPNVLYGTNNKGCIYFQKFIPDNNYDIRVTTIGDKNYIFKRYVRENDFRASGSGKIDYEVSEEDLNAIIIARNISDRIQAQTMAYDFIYDGKILKVCEMSYGFVEHAVENCGGWYDKQLRFHPEEINVYKETLNVLISGLEGTEIH